jgi:hypothetical protein
VPILGLAALQLALTLGSAVVYGDSRPRRAASLALAAGAPWVPWLLPADALFFRGFFAVFSLLPIFKWIQATADRDRLPLSARCWQWTSVFDVRKTRRAAPRLAAEILGPAVGWALVGGAGITAIVTAPPGADLVVRLTAGPVAVVGLVQSIVDAVRGVHAAFGVVVPPILDRPLTSVSVREFWGRRWNRTVSAWLRRYAFEPLARRGYGAAGVIAGFGISAAFHFYIVVVPLGWAPALVMAAFFVAQIPLVALERALPRSTPRSARRAFAIAALLGTSPLFTLPFTAILRGGGG